MLKKLNLRAGLIFMAAMAALAVGGTGMTMIVVIHDIAFARESGDHVAFFDRGTLCEVGEAKQVINVPREERTRQFL